MNNIFEIKNLNKSLGDFELKDINLSLPSGMVMGLIGENGAGKTSLLKSMLNINKRDSGSVHILGLSLDENEVEIKKDIGVVMENIGFNELFKLKDVELILKNMYKNWDSNKFNHYLEKFSIPSNKKIKDFSKGTKMKLYLAISLSHNAKLLILDEPTSGLDPIVRNEILDELMTFVQDEDKSIIFSSHITSDLDKIADYIVLIDEGKILFEEDAVGLDENYGIVAGSREELETIDKSFVKRLIFNDFYSKALIVNKSGFSASYPNFIVNKASIEDIMLFFIKGELQ